MHKNTKAALAVTTASVLLIGGAGTLASWNDSESVSGGDIRSGTLSLVQAEGQGCGDWILDAAGGGEVFSPGSTLLVPGDVITRTCTYTVNASGAHLKATAGLGTPKFAAASDADLVKQLKPSAVYTLGAAGAGTAAAPLADGGAITSADNGKVLTAVVSVTFDAATAGTTAQGVTATLDALTVSLSQQHA
ncbi:alternate-type signal peptide domain-containing protein [Nocardioides xinjiangensis]|uniref:alternate-type signal peptide domain-containing protein n=1 Tax=Nocardioides xinjiangensis TaxID=2817376 RepID=UPI001B30CC72|nr:alternate-type signal peptide domain-containing protein [Nocardioides sp. SYSU D00514]